MFAKVTNNLQNESAFEKLQIHLIMKEQHREKNMKDVCV